MDDPHPDCHAQQSLILSHLLVVAEALEACQDDWTFTDSTVQTVTLERGSITLVLTIAQGPIYTPCERDLIAIINELAPITTSKIIAELERREQLHGESTVRHALARLVHRGVIASSRRAPRGYRPVR